MLLSNAGSAGTSWNFILADLARWREVLGAEFDSQVRGLAQVGMTAMVESADARDTVATR